MRKKRNTAKHEAVIMLITSAMVLALLTFTGIALREKNGKENGDQQRVDFSKLEEKNTKTAKKEPELAKANTSNAKAKMSDYVTEDPYIVKENTKTSRKELLEMGDGLEEIEPTTYLTDFVQEEIPIEEAPPAFAFTEEDTLLWPVAGNVLIPYSMDKPVFFSTLEQYKCSPAMIIEAPVGKEIVVAANGQVTEVTKKDETGNTVTVNLGNGYEAIYGQLEGILVKEGDYVERGGIIGQVAAPTKCYEVEGSNVYFAVKKDGQYLDPMTKMN